MTNAYRNSPKTFRLSKEICKKILIAAAACLVYGVFSGYSGVVSSVIKAAIYSAGNLPYSEIQTAFTIGTFVAAFAAPVMAIFAMKRSNIQVLLFGFVMIVLGTLCMAFTTSFAGLILSVGILNAVGQSAFAFGLIFSMVSPFLGEKIAIIFSSLLSIFSSVFYVIVTPVTQYMTLSAGLTQTLLIYCGILALIFPLSILFAGKKPPKDKKKEGRKIDIKAGAKTLLKSRLFQLLVLMELVIGLTNGISNHAYVAMIDLGMAEMEVSYLISGMKIAGMAGSLLAAAAVLRFKKKFLLGSILFGVFALTELGIYFCHMDFTFLVPLLFVGTFLKKFPYTLSDLITRRYFSPMIIGTLMTILGLFSRIGSGINSIAGAVVFEYFHSFDLIFLIEGVVGAAGCIIILVFAVTVGNKLKPYEEQNSEDAQ